MKATYVSVWDGGQGIFTGCDIGYYINQLTSLKNTLENEH